MTKKNQKKQSIKAPRTRSEDLHRILPIGETRDLFDLVRVEIDDLEAWTLAVAGIAASSWRFEWYVKGWNVAEKVKRAKIEGAWPPARP